MSAEWLVKGLAWGRRSQLPALTEEEEMAILVHNAGKAIPGAVRGPR